MKRLNAYKVTLRADLEMKFIHSCPRKGWKHSKRLWKMKLCLRHSFTQRHAEYAGFRSLFTDNYIYTSL